MKGGIFSGMQSKTKYDEIPFVPCNDCSAYESCTQEAYEQGKAEGREEAIEEFKEKAKAYCKEHSEWLGELDIELIAQELKEQKDG